MIMRLSWGWVMCCPCWKQCKVFASWSKVEIQLYKILWPLSLSLLLIIICMQCRWICWRGFITPSFKCLMTWCTTFMMFSTWCGICRHRPRVNMLHLNSMGICLCCIKCVIVLDECLWSLGKIGDLLFKM